MSSLTSDVGASVVQAQAYLARTQIYLLNIGQCSNERLMDLPECKGSSCRAQQFQSLVHLLLVMA
jgi:hypothetical protein